MCWRYARRINRNNAQLDHALNDWWAQINEWRKRHGLRYDKDDSNGIETTARC